MYSTRSVSSASYGLMLLGDGGSSKPESRERVSQLKLVISYVLQHSQIMDVP